jgi:hypothetical protein
MRGLFAIIYLLSLLWNGKGRLGLTFLQVLKNIGALKHWHQIVKKIMLDKYWSQAHLK